VIKLQSHVLADTMVIIEAHRTNCWRLLVNNFKMDTVEKCVEECETGNQRIRNPVPVDITTLIRDLHPRKVGLHELTSFILKYPEAQSLDPGEKELLTYAMTVSGAFYICSPDKMCMRVGHMLGIVDSFISLQELIMSACPGHNASLRYNYTKQWLEGYRTEIKLDDIS